MNRSPSTIRSRIGGSRPNARMLLVAIATLSLTARAEERAAPAGQPGAGSRPADPGESIYFASIEQALGAVNVFSASKQDEPLREAPVPVSVITVDMIRSSGARTLQEALNTFVPGFTFVVDHNEANLATRGIYASSQQKVLVLLDGHRLNSRAFSSADPDYGIGLLKVKRIEVLRGPGSSLYGNVALMAVVNIITKNGRDVQGTTLRLGGGNYGQVSGEFLFGEEFSKTSDVLVWGHVFRADGQRFFIPAAQDHSPNPRDGYAIVGGAKDPVSYDVGGKYRSGYLTVLLGSRQGKVVEPFTSAGKMTGETYDYGSLRTFNGIGPGLASRTSFAEGRYERPLGASWSTNATAYFDYNELAGVYSADPATLAEQYIANSEAAYGAILHGVYAYDAGRAGRGNFMVGAQVERMQLIDSNFLIGANGDWTTSNDTANKKVILPGTEDTYSGFVQARHKLGVIVLNAGGRFDYKKRRAGETISDFSPRVAVVWMPASAFDVKLSYGQSFVDAPYWYRYNTIPSYRGASSLTPEHLTAVQFTPTVTFGKFRSSVNFFYDRVTDVIYRNQDPNLPATSPIYQNAGRLENAGVENETEYLAQAYRLRFNCTYQRVLSARNYPVHDFRVSNVPPFVANVQADVSPFHGFYPNLWLNAGARYTSRQLSALNIVYYDAANNPIPTATWVDPTNTVAPYVLVTAGVRLTDFLMRGFNVDATVYNALDTSYTQGGSVRFPYPQPGRWFLVQVSYSHVP